MAQPHYHVFLSHNSRDKGSVEPLAVMLREKGLNPFLDKWNLVPGEPIEDALIEALENSDSAVIFVGPGGEGPWQSEEMRDILKRAVKRQIPTQPGGKCLPRRPSVAGWLRGKREQSLEYAEPPDDGVAAFQSELFRDDDCRDSHKAEIIYEYRNAALLEPAAVVTRKTPARAART